MVIDAENQFSTGSQSGQSLAGFAGRAPLGNVIDASTNRDFGGGYPLELVCLFTAPPNSPGFPVTIDIQLVSAISVAQIPFGGNVMLDLTGGALPLSQFPAGTMLRARLPRAGIGGATGWLRYIGVNIIVNGGTLDGGTVNCFLAVDSQDDDIYAESYAVL